MIAVVKQPDGGAVLSISGPMRLAELGELLEHVRSAAALGGAITIDLSEAEHLHSGALQILRALERHSAGITDATFQVIAASDLARDALQLCGLSRWLEEGR